MANKEHLAILKQGVAVWNQWRKDNPDIIPNLGSANLPKANLCNANLSYARLAQANLREADLNSAELSRAHLGYTILDYANLRSAKLTMADLVYAYLSHASLRNVNLANATLSGANLSNADLSGAHLYQNDLSCADLSYANLSEVYLGFANLNKANLNKADFTKAKTNQTIFGNVDLSEVKGLETISHMGPSTTGIDTILKSKGNIPEVFLKGTGMPDIFISYMKSLTGAAFEYYSLFISYSSEDKPFAERLHADLQARGVRCWYAPEDLIIGESFVLGIDKGIRLHDKLLLVLSENSLQSDWVQTEVLSALTKERGKEPWVLFPIRLDNAVMTTDVHWADMIRESRHIGDFTQWKDHDAYQKAFDRLLRDLKQGSGT